MSKVDGKLVCDYCGAVREQMMFAIGASLDRDWLMVAGTGKITCPKPECYDVAVAEGQAKIEKLTGIKERMTAPDKIYFHCAGDPSTGIQPVTMELDLDGIIIEENEREEFGKSVADAIGGFMADAYNWQYSDECCECKRRLINDVCPEEYCISNIDFEAEND